MAETYRAAVVTKFREPLEIQQLEIPTPGPFEALVRVTHTGVCHTDLHAAHGDWPVKPNPPFSPGHEGVGDVVAIGDAVTRVKVGDVVGNVWLWSACGECEFCEAGWETLCLKQQNGGYSRNGSFGEYVLVDTRYCPVLPADVNRAEVAPVMCAGVTVYKGLKQTEAKPGDWMLISGVGGLGHIAVQYAKAMGMQVAAVDVEDEKLELATKLGADVVVNAMNVEDPAAAIREATGGGVHGALVTAVSGKAFPQALNALRRGGTISLVGLPPESFPLDIFWVVLNGWTVRGSIVGTRRDMEECVNFFLRGKVTPTITVHPLEGINDIFADMLAGKIDGRAVIDMSMKA